MQALYVTDVNDDGVGDVLIVQGGAPGNPGEVQALDGRNGSILWRLPHPDITALELQVADVDGDGERELILGLERPVSGPNTLYVYDLKTRALEWSSVQEVGGVEAIEVADADGDGDLELLWAPKLLRTRPDGLIHWRKASSHQYDADALHVQPSAPIQTGIQSMLVADVMGDSKPELLVGADEDTSGRVYIYSLPDRTLVRTLQTEQGTAISGLGVGDVTGDGVPELIAGVSSTTTASDDAQVVAFNPATGQRVWTSPLLSLIFGEINGMRVVDLDGDGRVETVVTIGSSAGSVSVVDSAGSAVRVSGTDYLGLEVMQVVGDARPEIIAGTGTGLLQMLSSSNLAIVQEWQACDGPIRAVSRNPFAAAGAHHVLFTCGMQLKSADLDSGALATISAPIALNIGLRNQLVAYQDTSGAPTLAVTARNGVHVLHTTTNLQPFVRPGDSCTGVAFSTHWRDPLIGQLLYGDHEGDALTLTVTAMPGFGSITMGGNGQPSQFLFEGEPFKGPDLFAIKASDGELESPITIVGVNLENDAPILPSTLDLTVAPGARAASGFAARDFDDDPLTFEILQAPTKGVLTLTTGDNFFYDAPANASGTDTFVVRAFDQVEYSEPLTYTITIAATPPPPPPPPPPSGGGGGKGGGGGRMDGALLLLLGALALLARRRTRARATP